MKPTGIVISSKASFESPMFVQGGVYAQISLGGLQGKDTCFCLYSSAYLPEASQK